MFAGFYGKIEGFQKSFQTKYMNFWLLLDTEKQTTKVELR